MIEMSSAAHAALSRVSTLQPRPLGAPAGFTQALAAATGPAEQTALPAAPDLQSAAGEPSSEGQPASGVARWREEITAAAEDSGLDAALLAALVDVESGGDPAAVSPAGARGLAQLMPGTADSLDVDPNSPDDNLHGGARYLRDQIDEFGSTPLALAAYNAGPSRVRAAGGIPNLPETQNYVNAVQRRAPSYGAW